MLDYLTLFISWVIYFFVHSTLASNHVKSQFIDTGLISPQHYRLSYSAISLVGFVLILILQIYLPSSLVLPRSRAAILVGLIIATYGILVLKKSFQFISVGGFLGADQENEERLIKEGLHAKVRHPIYLGTILILVGAVLFLPTDLMLVSALSIIVYLPIGIMLEEEKLVKKYGKDYLQYKKEVPALFPRWKSLF